MCLLFETIRIENGIILHPDDHEARIFRSCLALFGTGRTVSLKEMIQVPAEFSSGIVRCRLDYESENHTVKFETYKMRTIRTFRLVTGNQTEYPFKFSDRSVLESLLLQKKGADELIIVKEGLITDTSFSNLIFFDGREWFTPEKPLLMGTCRERLIREKKIKETKISVRDIQSFKGLKIINAMIYPDDMLMIPIKVILQQDEAP
jgi:4-amino-4-deoxychorismate lyase